MNFIGDLQKKRSNYNYADQARTQAESLKQLSAGIYTEEERFVYELLQNAVDAFVDTKESTLNVKIEIKNSVLCFMHNGAQFSERDIEGLCDVGRSNKSSNDKASNKKKVGYKGIGFKSVFMQNVESVCVKSGNYCFKFDKNECARLMPNFPEGRLSPDETPWQIIPIICDAPLGFDTSSFNVATFIETRDSSTLAQKINQLLSNPQFLLFLNASNINIELYNDGVLCAKAGRETLGEEVRLLRDGGVVSRWLVSTTEPIPVDESVRADLRKDFNTPQKLKEATHFEISFAIGVDESGDFVKTSNSVVYTFLPTSYGNLGLPFLVNANFITDAGRQQLHQEAKWNRIIFEKIPEYFLRWIATISPGHEDYWKILPKTKSLHSDSLTAIFDNALRNALSEVAFIPRLSDKVVIKPVDAVMDRVGISKSVGHNRLISHINAEYNKNYYGDNFVASQSVSLFKDYGVFIFDKNCLPMMFEDSDVFSKSVKGNVKLIEFLHSYDCEHADEQSEFRQMVKCSRCVLDENNNLKSPQYLFLPTYYKAHDNVTAKVTYMSSEVYALLGKDTKTWLCDCIGLCELSDNSFVDYLLKNDDYITEDNAIEVGRYLFKINSNSNIFSKDSDELAGTVKFLSRGGRLCAASELYLGDIYKPELSFEGVCDDDIFISSDYLPRDAQSKVVAEWKAFFLNFGVQEDICIENHSIDAYAVKKDEKRIDKEWIEVVVNCSQKYGNYAYYGLSIETHEGRRFVFEAEKIYFKSFSLLNLCGNYSSAKIILSRILSHNDAESLESISGVHVKGKCGFYDKVISQDRLVAAGLKSPNNFVWLVQNKEIIPTTQGRCELAKNVFINTIDGIYELAGPYLPVLDVDAQISDGWQNIFNFKRSLTLDDYLDILSAVSKDAHVDNKERVNLIYKRIVESGYQNDERILRWGQNNSLLSSNGEYMRPEDLSYITIEGFKNTNKAYVGRTEDSLRDAILCLLRKFGVRVITQNDVKLRTTDEVPDSDLKELLISKLQYLALLGGHFTDRYSFERCCKKLCSDINTGKFYHCGAIELTYGNDDDVVPRTTFSQDGKFYYTGKLKPTKLEPLMQPLAHLLNLVHLEKELLIILITQSHDELLEFLNEKGYDTGYLTAPKVEADGGVGEFAVMRAVNSPLDSKHMYAAQLEAQNFLMESRRDWSFPFGYGKCKMDGRPLFFSTVEGIKDENGEEIAIVLKSYKKRGEPFHINPEEWQWIVDKGAKLLVLTIMDWCLDIVEIPQENLISGQAIQLTFSTKNLDPQEHADRISIFADTLHYFSGLTFDFEQLYIAPNSTRIRDVEFQNHQKQNDVSDDDI